jgi:pimeloyl-ACP methyl ester carboxylesterase
MLPHDEAGSGPAVVLLHAGVADRSTWREHMQPLADAGFRVLAFDLPGFGEAPVADAGLAPWDDVLEAMDELSVDRAALVGNSFGAAVALRAAVVAPERVWALALISAAAPGSDPSPELEAAWEAEGAALDRGDVEAAVQAVVDAWTLPDAPPDVRDRVAAMQRRAFVLQADISEDDEEPPDPLDEHPQAAGQLEIPAVVAAGSRDMPDFREGGAALARTLPQGRFELVEGAGHLVPLEQPEAFRQLLLGFLVPLQ